MSAAKRNLYIEQGTDWTESFQIKLDGSAIALSGYSIAGQCRITEAKAATKLFDFTFSINTTTNTITVSVPKATTTALTLGNKSDDKASQFWYDYELTDPSGNRTRIQEGRVTIFREITQ